MAGGIEVAQAYVTIIPSMKDSQKTIADALDADKVGSDAGGKLGEGMGSGLSAKAVALGGVLSNVISGAIDKVVSIGGDLASGIYEGFAQNEQLTGGMQKLFGDSADTVIANANKAFMTSGKSANDYMESVTSFSASLVNSVGGDTAEAARLADVAMQAMSDNVNTFGTDADSVQNAIQGLAKGNYSMLDNLSLGFAGSQQGMVDLINASGVLDHELTKTSDLADVGFGTMIEAIQAVQEDMGIAGTTAKEAMGTMEGSVTAAKAAWDNVLTSIGSGDSEQLMSAASGLVDAVFGAVSSETGKREGGVIANFMRLFQNAFQTIGGILPDLASQALALLPESISTPLEGIGFAFSTVFNDALPAIKKAVEGIAKAIGPVISTVAGGILNTLQTVVFFVYNNVLPVAQKAYDTIAPVIEDIWADVSATFPQIQETIQSVMDAVGDLIKDVWPDIAATVDAASQLISDAIRVAWPVIQSVIGGAMERIRSVVETVWPIISNLVKRGVKAVRSAVENFGPMVAKVKGIFNRVKEAITHPIQTAKDAIKGAVDRISSAITGANLHFPHINLPHFSVSGGKAPWGIGGKGELPHFSVSGYAKGGWSDKPTLMPGLGERGGEFVWPSYAPYLDRYADALASRMGGTGGVNVYLTYNGSGDPDELVSTLTRELRVLKATGAI